MNKTLINIGVGYAMIVAWLPLLWLVKTVGTEPYPFVVVFFGLVFAGLGLTSTLALNDLQVRLDGANKDLRHCHEYVESNKTPKDNENKQEQLEQLSRDLDEIERQQSK